MKSKLFRIAAVVAVLLVTWKVFYDGVTFVTLISVVMGAILLVMLSDVVGLKLRKSGQRWDVPFDLRDNESVVLQAEANYLRRLRSIDGRLTLTNARLVFHAELNSSAEEVIYIADVAGVYQGDGEDRNILEIKVRSDEVYRFIVECPSRWARALLGVMGGG